MKILIKNFIIIRRILILSDLVGTFKINE